MRVRHTCACVWMKFSPAIEHASYKPLVSLFHSPYPHIPIGCASCFNDRVQGIASLTQSFTRMKYLDGSPLHSYLKRVWSPRIRNKQGTLAVACRKTNLSGHYLDFALPAQDVHPTILQSYKSVVWLRTYWEQPSCSVHRLVSYQLMWGGYWRKLLMWVPTWRCTIFWGSSQPLNPKKSENKCALIKEQVNIQKRVFKQNIKVPFTHKERQQPLIMELSHFTANFKKA